MSYFKSIYICRYNFSESKCQWLLTDDLEFAQSVDPNYQLASVRDLLDWVAASGEVFNGILAVKEGLCKWVERESLGETDELEYNSCYELIQISGV